MNAYHRYVQLGCIVQGLLLHLAINFREAVWQTHRSWLRTMKPELVPTELVVTMALKSGFLEFLSRKDQAPELKKFILARVAAERLPDLAAAA
jgi:hypothetical protein